MRPSEYLAKDVQLPSNPIYRMLTPGQRQEADAVIKAGFELIGSQLDENYREMTPDAVNAVSVLQGFLCAFIEHTMNPALIRERMEMLQAAGAIR